tara:strand:- start:2706 stop:3197 length:492 start_codon:yes stop_codon:yes gene_type:complete
MYHHCKISGNTMNEPHRWITSMFMHGGFVHLLFNMVTLYGFSLIVERDFTKKGFLIIYFIGGLLATAAQLYTSDPSISLVGASGAVCAVLAAFSFRYPKNKVLFFFVIPMEIKKLVFGVTFFSIFCHITGAIQGLGHMAHAGGLIFGWVFAKYIYPNIKLSIR